MKDVAFWTFGPFVDSSRDAAEAEFPFDGRTTADFVRSVLQYLDWQQAHGRPYHRVKTSQDFDSYGAAKHLLLSVWWALPARSMHVAGSVDYNALPACIEDWPEPYRSAEKERNRVLVEASRERDAQTRREYQRRLYLKSKDRERKAAEEAARHVLPQPFPVPVARKGRTKIPAAPMEKTA